MELTFAEQINPKLRRPCDISFDLVNIALPEGKGTFSMKGEAGKGER
jgi:hypothetical protein